MAGKDRYPLIAIVDDHIDFCHTLYDLLEMTKAYSLCPPVYDEGAFLEVLHGQKPDLALIDIHLSKDTGGIELLELILKEGLTTKPVMLSADSSFAYECYLLGAKGFVFKRQLEDLEPVINAVLAGRVMIPLGIGDIFIKQVQGSHQRLQMQLALREFSRREIEILGHLKAGLSRAAIADRLFISESTVKRHIENILKRTRAGSIRKVLNGFQEIL